MKYGEILSRIQQLIGLRNKEEARNVLDAVLGTLGESLYRTEERQLAAQLPKELKDVFYEYQGLERGRGDLATYPVEEFFNRVKARASISYQESQRQTKIVLSVLKEATGPGSLEEAMRQLPQDFRQLFDESNLEVAPEALPPFAKPVAEEYHVVSDEAGKWNVQKTNGEVIGSFGTKEQAIVRADEVADAENGDVLVIHNIDGSISKREAPSRQLME